MYKFPVYWTYKTRVSFLQRVVLIHSYMYYERNNSIWEDKKFDEISKQLVELQSKQSRELIRNSTQYGYVFFNFDGTTGFDLFDRLNKEDKLYISNIANRILGGV